MKKVIMFAVTGILFLALTGEAKAYEGPPGFQVDGKPVVFNETTGFPYLSETGRTMMPVGACLNSIGCQVTWDGQTRTVYSYKDSVQVNIPIGKNEIYVNQKVISTDTAAFIKNGRTYLPLTAVLEAYGYQVDWDGTAGIVSATSPERLALTPYNINGGTTGIFSRKQLEFSGFSGIQGDVTLPKVTLAEKGDCPYVYFGFDRAGDAGNAEGGFQFIEDPEHPAYNRWTVFLRQGNEWSWGENIALEQGSTHHLEFYSEEGSGGQSDLVIKLDGKEVVRKASAAADFSTASVKAVISMAMSKPFDGKNCMSKAEGARIENLKVRELNAGYSDFESHPLYSEFKRSVGAAGMWFGTVDCMPMYLHYGADGSVSIHNGGLILEQKALATSVAKRENYDISGNVTVTEQYIYYQDGKGQIIQAQLADPSIMKAVYQLPVWTYGDGEQLVYGSLVVENDTAYLKYHQGGAVMGADFLIRLNDDGTAEELQNSYDEVKILGDKTFSRWIGPMPYPGNLSMKTGDGEFEKLGNSDYLYTWDWISDGTTGGGFGPDDVYLLGDFLYILARDYEKYKENAATPGIYRIDIGTGETVRVNDREVKEFMVEGDFLYYHSDGTFYRQSLKDGKEEQIGQAVVPESEEAQSVSALEPEEIGNFIVLNGKIYWQKKFDYGLYDINGKNLNEGAVLDSMAVMGDSGEYLVCTFAEEGSEKFRIMVFDRDGDAVFKTPDKAYCRNISISGDRICFYNLTTGTVCIGQLNQ
ncbi:MAG TPA: stalk domain-containing protein [Anaerovoracaceae bacterium]|nr:stalk domain-containing protein [Anaerovoracaceae bacterium]